MMPVKWKILLYLSDQIDPYKDDNGDDFETLDIGGIEDTVVSDKIDLYKDDNGHGDGFERFCEKVDQ